MAQQPQRRFRLQVTITFLFTCLITVFGLIFASYSYHQTSRILLEGSERYFDNVSRELTKEYLFIRGRVGQTVQLLSHTGIARAATLKERLVYLPIFRTALKNDAKLTALQVGYDSGDYYIVRNMNSANLRELFQAPSMAQFMVDNISRGDDGTRLRHRFWYTDSLVQIAAETPVPTDYDPRIRPWYKAAFRSTGDVGTPPYFFHFMRQMGFTVGYMTPGTSAVIAGDVTLYHLSEIISSHELTTGGELVLLERHQGQYLVTAYKNPEALVIRSGGREQRCTLADLGVGVLDYAARRPTFLQPFYRLNYDRQTWLGSARHLELPDNNAFFLVMLVPEKEILADARRLQNQSLFYTLLMLLFVCPLTWLLARSISAPLQALSRKTEDISRFEFGSGTRFGGSIIKEVDELGNAMAEMETTLSQFLLLIEQLAAERDLDSLLERISEETRKIGKAEAAFTYYYGRDEMTLVPGKIHTSDKCFMPSGYLPSFAAGENAHLHDALGSQGYNTLPLDEILPGNTIAGELGLKNPIATVFPLKNRSGKYIGALFLIYGARRHHDLLGQTGRFAFLRRFSGFGAVTLESRQMIETLEVMLRKQKELLLSFIDVLAEAIDSKSPYTGGHCKRVPLLTTMLAQKACQATSGPFADFHLDEAQWEELLMAAGLHDCGKVTTPEYIVNKATKLETIYDRIHEIRMRFEVLKRDAHIDWLKQFPSPDEQARELSGLHHKWHDLDSDFAFIAECNIGNEAMEQEKIERLNELATRQWSRTLDDRLGISDEELRRKKRSPEKALPTTENLLADLNEHLITREGERPPDSSYGFKLNTPEYLYNRGELYNLSVPRGTLTEEDRYKINDHIVQTIIMLKKLPFPEHLRNVPDIAGSHHERSDGTGYPRRLTGEQMSVQAKIMVIADVFEALTAGDRPYKKAKTLSETVRIMASMVDGGHIDRDLFNLFLAEGVYLEYGLAHLAPEQVDEVAIEHYLTKYQD